MKKIIYITLISMLSLQCDIIQDELSKYLDLLSDEDVAILNSFFDPKEGEAPLAEFVPSTVDNSEASPILIIKKDTTNPNSSKIEFKRNKEQKERVMKKITQAYNKYVRFKAKSLTINGKSEEIILFAYMFEKDKFDSVFGVRKTDWRLERQTQTPPNELFVLKNAKESLSLEELNNLSGNDLMVVQRKLSS